MATPERALVTGATRGLGKAIALELGRRGYTLVVNYHLDDRQAEATLSELREVGCTVSLGKADVTCPEQVERLIRDATETHPVDLLVNNVGGFHFKPFLETPPNEWDAVMRSNLMSTVLCCRAVLPHMRTRSAGRIINVASLNAGILRAKPQTLPYAIAKAGIVLLTKTLAATEGEHGIRVNAVSPGFIETGDYPPSSVEHTVPLGRMGRAEEIAKAVAYLDSNEAAYITGAILDVHGGAFL